MIIFYWLITALLFGYRLLRILAIFQQKEYRTDRLVSFYYSFEGARDFFHFFPLLSKFHLSVIKRPKPTGRILLLFAEVLLLLLISFFYSNSLELFLVLMLFYIIFLPLVIWILNLPLSIAVSIITEYYLAMARKRINKFNPLIIGITGSYGKTTTKQLLGHVLSSKKTVWITPESINTPLGIARSILDKYAGQDLLILEFGAYKKGEIKHLVEYFPPSIVVLTGLSEQHSALFGNMQNTARAKAEILSKLPSDGKVFIANQEVLPIIKAAKKIYGKKYQVKELLRKDLIDQKLLSKKFPSFYTITTSLVSRIAREQFDISPTKTISLINSYSFSDRWMKIITSNKFTILDDGLTSNPTGFRAALNEFKKIKAKKKVLVTSGIVDLGKESDRIHLEIASLAAKIVDEVWYLGEPGKNIFVSKCDRVIVDENAVRNSFNTLDKESAVLIEGHIPLWMRKKLLKE